MVPRNIIYHFNAAGSFSSLNHNFDIAVDLTLWTLTMLHIQVGLQCLLCDSWRRANFKHFFK